VNRARVNREFPNRDFPRPEGEITEVITVGSGLPSGVKEYFDS
jgi:hypothetical protein